MLQTQTVSTVALQDMTIVRANVIAQRTGSLEIGLAETNTGFSDGNNKKEKAK